MRRCYDDDDRERDPEDFRCHGCETPLPILHRTKWCARCEAREQRRHDREYA
jgi:hypothetical protein